MIHCFVFLEQNEILIKPLFKYQLEKALGKTAVVKRLKKV